jgi:hypothetical protein
VALQGLAIVDPGPDMGPFCVAYNRRPYSGPGPGPGPGIPAGFDYYSLDECRNYFNSRAFYLDVRRAAMLGHSYRLKSRYGPPRASQAVNTLVQCISILYIHIAGLLICYLVLPGRYMHPVMASRDIAPKMA